MSGREHDQEQDPELEGDELDDPGAPDTDATPAEVLVASDEHDVLDLDDEDPSDEDPSSDETYGEDAPELATDGLDELPDGVVLATTAEDGADSPEAAEDSPLDASEAPPLHTILESVLFAAAEPVPLARLVKLLGAWPRAAVSAALDELREALVRDARGIRLAETAGGVQLRSAAECAPWVRHFFTEKPPRLSRAVLETMAIVAYRQPATRGEVEAVRGVNCDERWNCECTA